jgi:hypothetical protein
MRMALAIVVPVVALLLDIDRFFVGVLIPVWLGFLFAAHAIWDWIRHRKDPKGFLPK